jgi:hypothetical protein
MVHHQCNDTGNACITSVTDTGEACIAGINDTGRVVVLHWLVTLTLASHDLTSINNTGNVCIADVVDTGDGCSDTELIRY